MNATTQEPEAERRITTQRMFAASREKLFSAWANPEYLKQWWGPKGFTNTFDIFEFKPQGDWKFTMHSPDGTDYYNHCRFIEMQVPNRIIMDHVEPMHYFRVTATFEDKGENTLFSFSMVFDSVEECERVKMYVIPANEENFDRLENLLTKI